MPDCVACGAELEPPVRTLHTVYVKTLYHIGGQDYCRRHIIRAAVAGGVITEVRAGAGSPAGMNHRHSRRQAGAEGARPVEQTMPVRTSQPLSFIWSRCRTRPVVQSRHLGGYLPPCWCGARHNEPGLTICTTYIYLVHRPQLAVPKDVRMKKAVIAVALSVLVALLSSNVHTVAHAQGDLVAPSNVAAQNTGNPGEVRISWDSVPNAAYYRIGWVAYSDVAPIIASDGDWLEHFAFIDIENRGQTEHTITGLTPGVQYAFIMASNDGRYGTPRWPSSAGWAFLTLNEAPATHASLGSTEVNLTWEAVSGAAYYRIGWVVYEDVAPIIVSGGD